MAGGRRRCQHLNQLEQDEYHNGLCLPGWAEENEARIFDEGGEFREVGGQPKDVSGQGWSGPLC
jgi:hypothetical protein